MKRVFLLGLLTLSVLLTPVVLLAQPDCDPPQRDTRTWVNPDNPQQSITFSVPEPEIKCPSFGCCDVVYTQGVPANWTLTGTFKLNYVFANACLPAKVFRTIPINQQGDLDLKICYPAVDKWQSHEIRVDVSIWVRDELGQIVNWVGDSPDDPGLLGARCQTWNLRCLGRGSVGCTPGYWKNHLPPAHIWPAPYSPDDNFNAIFGVTNSINPDLTLLKALQLGGGGEKALIRHATAALLNAALLFPDTWSPCGSRYQYQFSVIEVIDLVREAYGTGAFNPIKNEFEEANEKMCPLADPPVWLDTNNWRRQCDGGGIPCNPF